MKIELLKTSLEIIPEIITYIINKGFSSFEEDTTHQYNIDWNHLLEDKLTKSPTKYRE